jgi:hypothetical protein
LRSIADQLTVNFYLNLSCETFPTILAAVQHNKKIKDYHAPFYRTAYLG